MKTLWDDRNVYGLDEIVVGMPATHYVGSDSYACVVTRVERFKSGAKQGQIKAVEACKVGHDGQPRYSHPDRFLPRAVQRNRRRLTDEGWIEDTWTEQVLYTRYEGKVAWWSSLIVGYATDHRDPHF